MQQGYDYVIISNSDVIYPRNLLTQMLRAVGPRGVGSVTAWSNNVSMYSLRNDDPDRFLADQERVDWISETLAGHYQDAVLDIPAGISFCILIPTAVVRDVGVMDPVFGRGYCEETDWSLRSLEAGYRVALATGTFVYHAGRGSNLDAGLVTSRHTSVPDNEAIIDLRYPDFRDQVRAFGPPGSQAGPPHGVGRDHAPGRPGARLHHRRRLAAASAVEDDVVRCTIAPDGLDGGGDGLYRLQARARRHRCVRGLRVAQDFFGGRAPRRSTSATGVPSPPRCSPSSRRLTRRHGNYPSRV